MASSPKRVRRGQSAALVVETKDVRGGGQTIDMGRFSLDQKGACGLRELALASLEGQYRAGDFDHSGARQASVLALIGFLHANDGLAVAASDAGGQPVNVDADDAAVPAAVVSITFAVQFSVFLAVSHAFLGQAAVSSVKERYVVTRISSAYKIMEARAMLALSSAVPLGLLQGAMRGARAVFVGEFSGDPFVDALRERLL